ncbi:MAG TPA: hypothetical protein VK590_00295 [Saprospiraceae bacterium]|nr:hypothetical protein [Saprospiraceae bacterium]
MDAIVEISNYLEKVIGAHDIKVYQKKDAEGHPCDDKLVFSSESKYLY